MDGGSLDGIHSTKYTFFHSPLLFHDKEGVQDTQEQTGGCGWAFFFLMGCMCFIHNKWDTGKTACQVLTAYA